MYFKRKVDYYLDSWLKKEYKSPALIVGIRQCGKTESIVAFAKRNKLNLIEMNFWTHPEYCQDFEKELDVNTIIDNILLRFPSIDINEQNVLIFFDEIQECPRARLSFKNFEKDGRFNVIGSGSYLGINGYVVGDSTPAPTGYDDIYNMNTLDFEEFLWALGYSEEKINDLLYYFDNKKEIPQNMHVLEDFLKLLKNILIQKV